MPTINATPAPRCAPPPPPAVPAPAPCTAQVDSFIPSQPRPAGPVFANGFVSGYLNGNVSGYVPGMVNGTISGTITGTLQGSDGHMYPFNAYVNVPVNANAMNVPRYPEAPQSAFGPDPQ